MLMFSLSQVCQNMPIGYAFALQRATRGSENTTSAACPAAASTEKTTGQLNPMHQEGLLVLVHADGKSHVDPMVSPSPGTRDEAPAARRRGRWWSCELVGCAFLLLVAMAST